MMFYIFTCSEKLLRRSWQWVSVLFLILYISHILIVKSQWHLIKYNWIRMGIKNLVENIETSCCTTTFAWNTVLFLWWPEFILHNMNRDVEIDARSKREKKELLLGMKEKQKNDFKQHILMSCENSTTRTESL